MKTPHIFILIEKEIKFFNDEHILENEQ